MVPALFFPLHYVNTDDCCHRTVRDAQQSGCSRAQQQQQCTVELPALLVRNNIEKSIFSANVPLAPSLLSYPLPTTPTKHSICRIACIDCIDCIDCRITKLHHIHCHPEDTYAQRDRTFKGDECQASVHTKHSAADYAHRGNARTLYQFSPHTRKEKLKTRDEKANIVNNLKAPFAIEHGALL